MKDLSEFESPQEAINSVLLAATTHKRDPPLEDYRLFQDDIARALYATDYLRIHDVVLTEDQSDAVSYCNQNFRPESL